jgi:capsid protein
MSFLSRLFGKAPTTQTLRGRTNTTEAQAPEAARRWNATQTNRLNQNHWVGVGASSTSITADQSTQLTTLRLRSQYEIANNAMLAGVVETWVADMLQKTGPHLRVKCPSNPDYAKTLMEVWQTWWERPDLRGRCSGVEMLRTAFRQYWSCGEYLIQIVDDPSRPVMIKGREFTTKIVGIHPRRLKSDIYTGKGNEALGIEIDKLGRPVAYMVEEEDTLGIYGYNTGTFQRIDAANIIHDFIPTEPDQIRGIPWLAYNLGVIAELADYDQQVLDAARLQASQTLFVYSDHAGLDPVVIPGGDSAPIDRGTMTVLPPGWKPYAMPATQPGSNYKEFRHERYRELGRFVGMPLLHIMLDAREHNFATARLDRQMYRNQNVSQQDRIEYSTLDRLYQAVWLESRLRKVLGDPPDDLIHEWLWPVLHEGDAKLSAQATTESLNNLTMSLTEAITARGRDPEDVMAEIAEDRRRLSELGITSVASPPQGEPPNDDA